MNKDYECRKHQAATILLQQKQSHGRPAKFESLKGNHKKLQITSLTNVGLAKEPPRLRRRGRRRGVLNLRRRRGARLAHGVCTMHDG